MHLLHVFGGGRLIIDVQTKVVLFQHFQQAVVPLLDEELGRLLRVTAAQIDQVLQCKGDKGDLLQIARLFDHGNDLVDIGGLELVLQLQYAVLAVFFADLDILHQGGNGQVDAAALAVKVGQLQLAQGVEGSLLDHHVVDAHPGSVVIMEDDELSVCGAMHVRFYAKVGGAVAGRHKGRTGVLLFQPAQAPVGHHTDGFVVELHSIHSHRFCFLSGLPVGDGRKTKRAHKTKLFRSVCRSPALRKQFVVLLYTFLRRNTSARSAFGSYAQSYFLTLEHSAETGQPVVLSGAGVSGS